MWGWFSRRPADLVVPIDLRVVQAEINAMRKSHDRLQEQLDGLTQRFDRIEAAAEAVGDAAVFLGEITRSGHRWQETATELERRLAALEEKTG